MYYNFGPSIVDGLVSFKMEQNHVSFKMDLYQICSIKSGVLDKRPNIYILCAEILGKMIKIVMIYTE